MYAPKETAPALNHLSSLDLCAARPDLEAKDAILWEVLKAAIFLDNSLAGELARETRPLACRAGCDACCHQPIPLSLAEALAIKSFLRLAEIAPSTWLPPDLTPSTPATPTTIPAAPTTKETTEAQAPPPCIFLREGRCTIYPVRPFACRRYLVFNRICFMGENPTLTRPQDMLKPSLKNLFTTLCMTLPVYSRLGRPIPKTVTREFFVRNTFLLQDLPEITKLP